MPAEDWMSATKVLFAKFGLPNKLVFDKGTNSVSEQFKDFCRCLNIDHGMTLSYNHQCNGQVEACVKFKKCTIKKCRENNNNVNFALLQIRSTLIGAGGPNPAMLLFHRPIKVMSPQIGRESLNINK